MEELFNKIVEKVSERIARDVVRGKNLNMLLEAYNEWQEDERDGADYIFNINDTNDLKYLVDRDMISATTIAWVVKNCEEGIFMFANNDPDSGIVPISLESVKRTLIMNAQTYLPYIIMYAARCGSESGYAKVYEEYITQVLERSKNFV